jgi:hypothetical protein
MRAEIFPYLSYIFGFKLPFLTNLGYAIAAICYLIIFLKIKHSKDGAFRRYLLGYFGAATFAAISMCFSNPFYNYWLMPVAHLPLFVALVLLVWHILNEFWTKKNH